ncbi:leucine-rich repeat transmembrane protein kinase protein, partial [Tanacetum coccineum]
NPFISTLDLRLLEITMYESQFPSLILLSRDSFGTNEIVRYNNDMYDRIWYPLSSSGCRSIKNSTLVSSGPSEDEKVPLKVMRNAVTPIDSDNNLFYSWDGDTADEDLSYNNLGGTVPQFLASLNNLKLLNLTGNNFTRPLPAELLAKSKKGSLFLSGDQDKGYCLNGSCKDTKHTIMLLTSDSSNCHTHHAIDRVCHSMEDD